MSNINPNGKIIGIVGTRSRNTNQDYKYVFTKFCDIYNSGDWICSGGCPKGADNFAERIAKEHGISVHTDAAQAVGKMGVAVCDLGVDFLTIAGHKLYGPKGIGALYIRNGQNITPLIHGAAQEGGLRAGTENVILAAGLGAACGVAKRRLKDDQKHMRIVRNRLQDLLFDEIDGLVLNGHPERRLPNTLSISIPGIRGAEILEGLPSIMASTGAACHENEIRLSYVLSAMGVLPEIGMGTLRLTVGRSNTTKQIEEAARQIIDRVKRIRDDK